MIYNFSMNKIDTYDLALTICKRFLEANGLPLPKLVIGPPPHAANEWQTYGLYIPNDGPGTVYVNVAKATRPQRVRGRIWSFPGHKTDRTAAGILSHEIGHHVSLMCVRRGVQLPCVRRMQTTNLERPTYMTIGNYKPWQDLLKTTKPVTSYEPVPDEAFAETMRLFILNPDLLQLGRPMRYEFLTEHLKLDPVVTNTYREVLLNAPEFILDAASKFASEKEAIHRRPHSLNLTSYVEANR